MRDHHIIAELEHPVEFGRARIKDAVVAEDIASSGEYPLRMHQGDAGAELRALAAASQQCRPKSAAHDQTGCAAK